VNQIQMDLPWPPSVNRYWRHWRGRTLVSRAGRAYRQRVAVEVLAHGVTGGLGNARVKVEILARPPDRRLRDLDNLLKGLLDACTRAGIWDDDGQIDDLRIMRGEAVPGGNIVMWVTAIQGAPA